jgi:tripartite-type tricarboxylate transporter receptor subunit TctC
MEYANCGVLYYRSRAISLFKRWLMGTHQGAVSYDHLDDYLNEFVSIAGTVRQPLVMVVNPSVPANTVPKFIAYAKANPGKINMASAGMGSGTPRRVLRLRMLAVKNST